MTIAEMTAERDRIMKISYRERTDEQKDRWQELGRLIEVASLAELGDGVGVLEYDSNNSGGSWWLKDEDWLKLEENGWTIHWARPVAPDDSPFGRMKDVDMRPYSALPHELVQGDYGSYEWAKEHRWLGAVAASCAKAGADPNELLQEFERLADQDSADEGCNCCGRPHNFEWHDPGTGEARSPKTETIYVQHGF